MSGDERLRRAAEAATPGPWRVSPVERGNALVGGDPEIGDAPYAEVRTVPDAEFIATFDPPTVLALLDEMEALRWQVERVRNLGPTWHRGMYGCPDDMFSRRDLRAALDGPR